MNLIYTQKGFIKKFYFFSEKMKDYKNNKYNRGVYKCPVHILFLSEPMVKIFSREKIMETIKNKFKDINNIKYFIQLCSQICIDINLRQKLKNIFNIDYIINKYIGNNNKELKIYVDFPKDNIEFDKIIPKINEKMKGLLIHLMENNDKYREKIYIKKLIYKEK